MASPACALSMTTDYAEDTGCPEPYLRRIAEAGFTHVHWCHHWNTDFLYSPPEVRQIERWFRELDLRLNDLHASAGREKNWRSEREYERLAGVRLVENRIEMAATLGSDVIIMHLPGPPEEAGERPAFWERIWRSFDELERAARSAGVRIALENEPVENIERVLSRYPSDYVGLCYDSGHGNMRPDGGGLDGLERVRERLISVHLHDNDGSGDQHNLPFSGTVDWERLAGIMAASPYIKPVGMEVRARRTGCEEETAFLRKAFETGTTFTRMIERHRT